MPCPVLDRVKAISRWISDLTKQVALVVDYSSINDFPNYVQCTADHFKLELLKDTGSSSALDKYIHVCTLRIPKCSKSGNNYSLISEKITQKQGCC